MTTGLTTRKIRMEIRSILKSHAEIISAWGFGSFFRGERHNDIDVLVVVDCQMSDLLDYSSQLRAAMHKLQGDYQMEIDVLILTMKEFEERPLRDMDQLVSLYRGAKG